MKFNSLFDIKIENPTKFQITLDFSFQQMIIPEIKKKIKLLAKSYPWPIKFFVVLKNLIVYSFLYPLKALFLRIQKKPYYYLYLPILAENNRKNKIILYPLAIFLASWDYVFSEKLNDKRTFEEKKESLLEKFRHNTAFSIAHEIRHLTQPQKALQKDKNSQNLVRFIILPCVFIILLKALFWDTAIKHDWGSFLAVLSGLAAGLLFSLFFLVFLYNHFFYKEKDANKYAEQEEKKWVKRVKVFINY